MNQNRCLNENITFSTANGKTAISTLNFTNDQSKAYNELIGFINAPYNKNDYKRALIGAAGTGKTYLVKALIQNSNMSYSTIGLAAPTHKACRVLSESINIRNVKVNTLQSDLGLRLNFDVEKFDINNPPFDPKGNIKIGEYKLYIVDESSMINKGLYTFLERLCKEKQCKIIYIGDDSQLAPVGETYSSTFTNIKISKLSEIVRQGEDNPVSYLLDLLRYDIKHKTYSFLNYICKYPSKVNEDYTKGYSVCNTKTFNNIIYNNFNDSQITSNIDYARIIAFTNNRVSYWNKIIRNAIIKDADKSIITKNDLILSYSTLVDKFNDCIIKNSEEYILKDVVNYIHPKYNIKGFMVRFTAIHGGDNTTPLFIVDHKDKFSIATYVKISREFINAAKTASGKTVSARWKEYYSFKESCLLLTNIINNQNKIEFSRDLDYGFALTAHKSQGSTFDTVFVDVNDIIYDKYGNPYTNVEEVNRRLYVACSRCKNKLYLYYGN